MKAGCGSELASARSRDKQPNVGGSPGSTMRFHRRETRGLATASILALLSPVAVQADEGGASVWLPGQFASFAAVPDTPGFSVEALFYGQTASATANISFSRGG